MKKLAILIAVLLLVLYSGCSGNKTPSEPAETISPTPQVGQPTDEPEVSSTPTPMSTPDATTTPASTEPEPTETSRPEPTESPATTTPASPTETQTPEPTAPSATETPKPSTPSPTEPPKAEPSAPLDAEGPKPTVPPVTEASNPIAPPVTESPKPTTAPSTKPDSGLKWEDYDLADALSDNREFLDTYIDTPTNFLISLLGFDGLVNQIKDTASENVTLTEACIPLVDEITDINVAAEYHQAFVKINSRMAACNERTLEVKQSRDIGSFESALSNTVEVLQDYQVLLESFKEEAGA